ncbi:hypothetical protein P153DRAFT_363356 [Dothidotthia symphoricarpi CBS 119687]|uniref:Uncharacterized protein n=1 Tax=Dothidotthia symphoricarpi CBS 119687 TaxID=1392245 RepID=A0A6A6AQL5_9PLEO|nr:uncharacterized protein P153DRAFT_363356 [Dothidotthia symphoricarpi CBS 119687]KAF2133137.1 hypothetical protein P153DRAFT_363356 [Dothidotthia symphoricarpi CBS 119687]
MADPISMVAGLLALISATTSIISTAYDIARHTRMPCEVANDGMIVLEEVNALLKEQDSQQRNGGHLLHCLTELQKLMSDRTLKRRLRFGDQGYGVVAPARCSQFLRDHCRSKFERGSQFWRLQRYTTSLMGRLPPSTHDMLAKPFKNPSPFVLLLSWLVLAIAVAAWCKTQTSHQHRRHYLIGSMLMAFVLGGIEGSGMTTTILTNIPWCLTLGMLLHFIVGSVRVSIWTHAIVPPHHVNEFQDLEKMACTGDSSQKTS